MLDLQNAVTALMQQIASADLSTMSTKHKTLVDKLELLLGDVAVDLDNYVTEDAED